MGLEVDRSASLARAPAALRVFRRELRIAVLQGARRDLPGDALLALPLATVSERKARARPHVEQPSPDFAFETHDRELNARDAVSLAWPGELARVAGDVLSEHTGRRRLLHFAQVDGRFAFALQRAARDRSGCDDCGGSRRSGELHPGDRRLGGLRACGEEEEEECQGRGLRPESALRGSNPERGAGRCSCKLCRGGPFGNRSDR